MSNLYITNSLTKNMATQKHNEKNNSYNQFVNTVTVFGKELLDYVDMDKYLGYTWISKRDGKPKYAVVVLESVDLYTKRVKVRYTYNNSHREGLEGWKEYISIAKIDLHNRFFKAKNRKQLEALVNRLIEVEV